MSDLQEQRKEIIEQLEVLNAAVKTQNSIPHIFMTGIIYGVGFVVGSAILATLTLGVIGPLFGKIPFIHNAFSTGVELMQR